jgi:hypothetical protein
VTVTCIGVPLATELAAMWAPSGSGGAVPRRAAPAEAGAKSAITPAQAQAIEANRVDGGMTAVRG